MAFQTGRTVARLFNHFTDSTEMVGELAGGGSSEGAEGAEEQHDHIVPDQASALLVSCPGDSVSADAMYGIGVSPAEWFG